ncbi:MAG: flagellar basal body P-ring formation protein FlgA [Sulfuricella sp.]|nr:flagellar basal body P-ring formation protein FlgA [Sulfuricella sp.]
MRPLLYILAAFFSIPAYSAPMPMEDAGSLRQIAETFVLQQAVELPGQASAVVGVIDSRLRLPKCSTPEAFLPPGTRLWGNTTVGIRCAAPAWSIYVQVAVKVMAMAVTAAKPLTQGQYLSPTDLATQLTDLTQLPSGVLTDPEQAIGKTLTTSLPAGQALRSDMLRSPLMIKTGQVVKLIAQNGAFQVSSEGKALANGGPGQTISVRTASGKVVSGVVKADGSVEVPF